MIRPIRPRQHRENRANYARTSRSRKLSTLQGTVWSSKTIYPTTGKGYLTRFDQLEAKYDQAVSGNTPLNPPAPCVVAGTRRYLSALSYEPASLRHCEKREPKQRNMVRKEQDRFTGYWVSNECSACDDLQFLGSVQHIFFNYTRLRDCVSPKEPIFAASFFPFLVIGRSFHCACSP